MSSERLGDVPEDYVSQFFHGDVVTKKSEASSNRLWRVVRCWADDDPDSEPGFASHKALLRGQVGLIDHLTFRDHVTLPESELNLYCRHFMPGDTVKRSLTSPESAVIIDAKCELKVKQAWTQEAVEGWIPLEKFRHCERIVRGDIVFHDEWVGEVFTVMQAVSIETKGGDLIRLLELGGNIEPGAKAVDALQAALDYEYELVDEQRTEASEGLKLDRIVKVHPRAVHVHWLAINQTISRKEQDKHPRPQMTWSGDQLSQLTMENVDVFSRGPPTHGAVLAFKNPEDVQTYGVKQSTLCGGQIEFDYVAVSDVRSTITLLWQSGREETGDPKDFVPYDIIDEHDSWPGNHLSWRGENDKRRHAVLQSLNPRQRVAEVLFLDTKQKEVVPLIETSYDENIGVPLGGLVLLLPDGSGTTPEVMVMGATHTNLSNEPGADMIKRFTEDVVKGLSEDQAPSCDTSGINWLGRVRSKSLDGTTGVLTASNEMKHLQLNEMALLDIGQNLDDGFDDIDGVGPLYGHGDTWDMNGETMEYEEGPHGMMMFMTMSEGSPGSEASWETMSQDTDDKDADAVEALIEGNARLDHHETLSNFVKADPPGMTGNTGRLVDATQQPLSSSEAPSSKASPLVEVMSKKRMLESNEAESGPSSSPSRVNASKLRLDDDHWKSFDVLETAPLDHHYINEPILQASNKEYRTRLQKEHRTLSTSLPDNILVRTYEDRTDLMRCLIIGPKGTPYAEAPFVFDLYLKPTTFPNEPPSVHFHSHTNGHGRCNPNLYEEGRVCLSILGTWMGEKSESWSSSQSSLLQVLVSISGLVLVRSPYHCEPAFAKLQGTLEGKLNSRLYSEKAYVLSRGFIKTALTRPPIDLESEIKYYYLKSGKLRNAIDHAKRLLVESQMVIADSNIEDEGEDLWNGDGIGRLSLGAGLSLKRIITDLEAILAKES